MEFYIIWGGRICENVRMKMRPLAFVAAGTAALLLAAAAHPRPVSGRDWRTADRSSAGLAPSPEEHPGAVVQGYAARAFRWRGVFAVHCWISVKEKDSADYRVYHLVGWRLRRSTSAVVVEADIPDRRWYGKEPASLFDIRG